MERKGNRLGIYLAVIAACMGLSLASSVTATYAFFEVSSSQKAQGFDFSFAGEDEIKIGLPNSLLGDVAYYQDVDSSILQAHYPDLPASISTVTTAFGGNSGELPTFYADPPYFSKATRGFVQFDVYLLSSESCYVYLEDGSGIAEDANYNRSQEEALGLEGGSLKRIEQASRLALSYDGATTIFANEGRSVNYAAPLDLDFDGYADSIGGKDVLYGDYEGEPTYIDDEGHVYPNGVKTAPGNLSIVLDGEGIAKESNESFSSYVYDGSSSTQGSASKPLFFLEADKAKKITISFYVEGFDPLADNSLSGASAKLSLGFVALFQND